MGKKKSGTPRKGNQISAEDEGTTVIRRIIARIANVIMTLLAEDCVFNATQTAVGFALFYCYACLWDWSELAVIGAFMAFIFPVAIQRFNNPFEVVREAISRGILAREIQRAEEESVIAPRRERGRRDLSIGFFINNTFRILGIVHRRAGRDIANVDRLHIEYTSSSLVMDICYALYILVVSPLFVMLCFVIAREFSSWAFIIVLQAYYLWMLFLFFARIMAYRF